MLHLFNEGGILFMSILTLLLLAQLSISVYYGILIFKSEPVQTSLIRHRITYIKTMGLLSLVVGILGQLIGMYSGFSQIQKAGEISQALLVGGIKVSMITTLYGLVIFIVSYLIWLGLDFKLKKL